MHIFRTLLAPFPRVKGVVKNLMARLRGMPPISYTDITKEQIRQYVGKENPVILEIGCNDGTHTKWFLEAFAQPHIYCFEPDPRAIERFKANLGSQKNVKLFECALSDKEGEITFYQSSGAPNKDIADYLPDSMPDGWDLSGSIRPPKEHLEEFPWVKFDTNITVPTITLDAWCKQQNITEIDFIWMDVQGAEIDVFRGGAGMLPKTRYIFTEYSERQMYSGQYTLPQLLEYLKDFVLLVRYQGDILLKNKHITQ
jgi:FkbM family methyltransferase